jgi:2-methylcitrate dehydratase PrpD
LDAAVAARLQITNSREDVMQGASKRNSLDRRSFLGTGALAMLGVTGAARAQEAKDEPKAKGKAAKGSSSDSRRVSQSIAEFVTGFDLAKVPQPVIDRARTIFIDTIGVMLAGSHEEASRLVLAMVKAEGSAPQASIVQESLRASPQLAALVNGVAAHAMDYDFTFLRAQSIAALIPAILPLAEVTKATPAEVLAAYIIGAEVAARFVRTDQNGPTFDGWHATGMVGVLGVAAACARLMQVPAEAIPNIMGITASLASGVTANFGTMTKPLHCGNAARNGVLAAVLGRSGYTANAAVFEGRNGYFQSFSRGVEVSLDGFNDFGTRYDLLAGRHRFKPYPCGGLTHTTIEAALDLRPRVGGRFSEIKNIHCFVARAAGQRAATSYPTTTEAAKFSVGYLVPYALVHGAPRIAAFTDKALQDDQLKALQPKVTASVDPDLGRGEDDSPARLRITMADGEVFEVRKDFSTGSHMLPMSQAQLEEKFYDCAAQVMDKGRAAQILAVLNALPARASFDDFWPLFRKA